MGFTTASTLCVEIKSNQYEVLGCLESWIFIGRNSLSLTQLGSNPVNSFLQTVKVIILKENIELALCFIHDE